MTIEQRSLITCAIFYQAVRCEASTQVRTQPHTYVYIYTDNGLLHECHRSSIPEQECRRKNIQHQDTPKRDLYCSLNHTPIHFSQGATSCEREVTESEHNCKQNSKLLTSDSRPQMESSIRLSVVNESILCTLR